MYVPANHPQYTYYYGILMTALTKGKVVDIPNISVFDGTTACDVTKTECGITILKLGRIG
jgi:putative methionine-R-sulfoxide reductase with GAF domain